MKQVYKNSAGINVLEVPLPTLNANQILVDVKYSVISSGTETIGMRNEKKGVKEKIEEKLALWKKVKEKVEKNGLKMTVESVKRKLLPSEHAVLYQPAGYSNAGIIIAKGSNVIGFNVGDPVACAGGGFASHSEFAIVPTNLAIKIPDNVSLKEAAFTTLGSIAMQGLRRADLSGGESVVIYGLGLLGLLAVQIAKAWGLKVIGTDIKSERLEMGRNVGADFCVLSSNDNFINEIIADTDKNGVDAVIIYASSKSSELVNSAMKMCRSKGRVVLVGAVGMNLDRELMYQKELDLLMSTSYGPGRYDDNYEIKGIDYPIGYVRWTENRNMLEFVNLLRTKKVNVTGLIGNIFDISQAQEAYRSLVEPSSDIIANLFEYELNSETKYTKKYLQKNGSQIEKGVAKNKINVGIIGAGSFLKRNHLKNMQMLDSYYRLVAGANKTPVSAKQLLKDYQLEYVTTDYKDILDDTNIDMVVIGTRHDLHAQIVIDSIKAGKHILVEKPLAIKQEDLIKIEEALQSNPNVRITVGFNRRYSPLIKKIKEVLNASNAVVMINYRINAGFIDSSSWIQNLEIGGGRIHGECCHFIDLVNYLISSEISKIHAVAIPVDNKKIKSEDNVIITMKYTNGSIAVITYSSIGGRDMEKERIELFTSNMSIVLDDFQSVKFYNCNEKDVRLSHADKGMFNEIEEFAKLLTGEKSEIPSFDLDFYSTQITQTVVDIINGVK